MEWSKIGLLSAAALAAGAVEFQSDARGIAMGIGNTVETEVKKECDLSLKVPLTDLALTSESNAIRAELGMTFDVQSEGNRTCIDGVLSRIGILSLNRECQFGLSLSSWSVDAPTRMTVDVDCAVGDIAEARAEQ